MAGYIKIYRKLLEWGWYDDSAVKAVFLHLLLTANFRRTEYHGRAIERGQAVFGRENLAAAVGITVQQARTALNKLKSTGEITIQSYNKFSVATIRNFELYQGNDADAEQQDNNQQLTNNQPTNNQQITIKQPTNNHQLTTSEEGKKERREEIKRECVSKSVDYAAVVEAFNAICISLPKVTKLTDARRGAIRSAALQGIDFDKFFRAVEASDFLTNRSGKLSGCGFDWILKPANMVKIMEGNYTNKPAKTNRGSVFSAEGASFDISEYEGKSMFDD